MVDIRRRRLYGADGERMVTKKFLFPLAVVCGSRLYGANGELVVTKKFIILAALPFLLVAAAFFGARSVDFEELVFSPLERRVLHFSPETIEVRIKNGARMAGSKAISDLRSVTGFFRAGKVITEGGGRGVLLGGAAIDPLAMKVSFIMRGGSGSGNLAIVNNELVIEGDTIGGMLVKRIEEDKVLLKGKEMRWVYMEALR